jgi:hypothetical protein
MHCHRNGTVTVMALVTVKFAEVSVTNASNQTKQNRYSYSPP